MCEGVVYENSSIKSFYWYFRPLGLICKFLGVFPIQNVHCSNPAKLEFRICSFAHLYSIFVFWTTLVTIYYYSRLLLLSQLNLLIFVIIVMLTRSTICFVFCTTTSKELPTLLKLLDLFDRRMQNDFNCFRRCVPLQLFLWTILPFVLGATGLCISFYQSFLLVSKAISSNVLEKHELGTACIFFSFLTIWQIIPLLLYTHFCTRILSNFKLLNELMLKKQYNANYLAPNHTLTTQPGILHDLKRIRFVHNLLSECVQELEKCYGNLLALDHLVIIVMFVVNIAVYVYLKNQEANIFYLTVLNAIMVLVVIFISDGIKETGMKIIDSLKGISVSEVDEEIKTEVHRFLTQIASRPIEIKASGYFTLDKGQIPSVSISYCNK